MVDPEDVVRAGVEVRVVDPDRPAPLDGILLVGPLPPPIGGVSVHVARLSGALDARGIGHFILNESRTPAPGTVGIRQVSPLRYLRMMRMAQLVHIHTSNRYVRLVHTLAARIVGARVVHTVHGHNAKLLARTCLRLACLLGHERIAVSDAVAREIGMETQVIPAFIPPRAGEEAIPDDLSAWLEMQRTRGRRVIAMNAGRAARIDGVDLYGLDMTVEAFRDPAIGRNFSAMICIGDDTFDPEYLNKIKYEIEINNLTDKIRLVANRAGFSGILKSCDLFVRPTTTDGDAISIREALWYGVPVVASDAVLRPQSVTTFPARDQARFNAAILGAVARSTGGRHPGDADFVAAIVDVYTRVLARSPVDGANGGRDEG